LRYSTVFGPGQRKESKLAEIADKCLANKNIFFPKDSVRNFIFVKDVATANLLALKSKRNLVLNIAGKENVSFSRATEILKEVLKSKSKIKIGKKSNAKFKISTELARKTIGFSPKFSFQDGIKQTFAMQQ